MQYLRCWNYTKYRHAKALVTAIGIPYAAYWMTMILVVHELSAHLRENAELRIESEVP